MLGLKFFKGLPTDYVIKYVGGQIAAEGVGLAFSYLRHNTQIVVVPINSKDGEALFTIVTRDLQPVSLQMCFTFRVVAPHCAATQFNFSLDTSRRTRTYNSRVLEKLMQRVANILQSEATEQIQQQSMDNLLFSTKEIAQTVTTQANALASLHDLGIEILDIFFASVRLRTDIQIAGERTLQAPIPRAVEGAPSLAARQIAPPKIGRRATDLSPRNRRAEDRQIADESAPKPENSPTPNSGFVSNGRSPKRKNAETDGTSGGNYLFVSSDAARAAKILAEENRVRTNENV